MPVKSQAVELNKDNNRHAKEDGEKATKPQLYSKNYRQLRYA